jgi:hypothetical protein
MHRQAGPITSNIQVTVRFRYRGFALLLLAAILALPDTSNAQTVILGTVVDAADNSPIPGVNVVATRLAADSTTTGVATATDGSFALNVAPGPHRLRVTFVGYITERREVSVSADTLRLGRIALTPDVLMLDEAVVEAVQERVVVRGDTTVYNADAYTVNPDASAEDLIRRMPGVVVQDGQVQAQGEQVRRVLVDGEEFFGNDATAALRNLPAEMIQQIEVFDRGTDQARFTGFQDGNEERTMNVVTRPGMRTGQFGRVYGGIGTDGRYNGGGAVNVFNGSRRISLIGLTNNVNQQNFAFDDLLGVLSDGGGRRGGGGGMRGGGGTIVIRAGGGGGGGMRSGGGGMSGSPRDYLVGEQGGLNRTSSLGVNYTDRWGDQIRVNGSYFFNHTGNNTDAWLERAYLAAFGDQNYVETTSSESGNTNHRLNFRMETDLSEATQLIITPRASVQMNSSESLVFGSNVFDSGLAVSGFDNASDGRSSGYNTSTTFLVRHRFPTEGRTLSVSLGLTADGNDGLSAQRVNQFWEGDIGPDPETGLDYSREIDTDGTSRGVSGNIALTERLSENGILQLNYRPSFSVNRSDQDAYRLDRQTGQFSIFDPEFTTRSERDVWTQSAGASYRIRAGRLNTSLGAEVQHEQLSHAQTGGRPFAVDRNYWSVLPNARLQIDLGTGRNLNMMYRTSTSTPGASQLRDVIDDSNPLFVTTGNPALDPSTTHSAFIRYRSADAGQGTMLMGMLSLNATRNYVANAIVQAGRDSVAVGGIILEPGARFSSPVNMDGYIAARSFVAYGRPIGLLRSNLNATLGANVARIPAMTNGVETTSRNTQLDGRLFLGSNISPQIDFSLSYGLTYSHATNASIAMEDTDSYRHRASAQTTLRPWGPLLFETNLTVSHYAGLSATVDPTSVIWNAAIGYKFLRSERAEIRFGIVDVLSQNTNISRNVTDLYIEDFESQAIGRYFMMNLIYQVRHFGARR